MMKIIIPMARLAMVSVTHVLGDPISGMVTSAKAIGSNNGMKSRLACGSGSVAARSVIDAPPG